jgi:hypothetical protein
MSWTQPGQGFLREVYLEEALGTIRLGQLKAFNGTVPLVFKRTSGKDGGFQEYDLVGKYKQALYMTLDEPNKEIMVYLNVGDNNLDDLTTDMFPKKYHDADDTDWESQKLQWKFFDIPMEKEIAKAVKRQYPKFKFKLGDS